MKHTKHYSTKKTPQTKPIPGKKMKQNNAGGFSFEIDIWKRLDRFLILGSESGTYYVNEQKLTVDNAENVVKCIKENGRKTVDQIVSVSDAGRAPKNDPAIFALALCCTFGNEETKKYAYYKITSVCRIGTHIFQFCQAIQDLRGWSAGLRKGVASFYTEKEIDDVAYQVIKYQQRDGWTHKDVLRLSHPKVDVNKSNLFKYVVGKDAPLSTQPKIVQAFENIKSKDTTIENAIKLIIDNNIPRECIPTEMLNSKDIWNALLQNMPMTAMIRNLGKMTEVGLLKSNLSEASKLVCNNLLDKNRLKKARIHPLNLLLALSVYSSGEGMRGSLTWKPVANIIDALNEAFYLSFDCVEPTGKNYLLAVDVSGSMDGGNVAGTPLTPREAAAAMAMVAYRTENANIVGFSNALVNIPITKKSSLQDVVRITDGLPFGGTDCALPMIYAKENKLPIDVFVVYTDSETWAGIKHPVQALREYRQFSSRQAKLIVVGMTATEITIADPDDPGMLDICGFDTSVPAVMSEFVR